MIAGEPVSRTEAVGDLRAGESRSDARQAVHRLIGIGRSGWRGRRSRLGRGLEAIGPRGRIGSQHSADAQINASANVAMLQGFMVSPLSYGTGINTLWRLSMFS